MTTEYIFELLTIIQPTIAHALTLTVSYKKYSVITKITDRKYSPRTL